MGGNRRQWPKPAIVAAMVSKITQSGLLSLIQAGHLARQSLQQPLAELGLQPGDDAILLAMKKKKPVSSEILCRKTGLVPGQLQPRIERLLVNSLIIAGTVEGSGSPDFRLSKKGRAVRKRLVARWLELEAALIDELGPSQRNILKKTLERFVELLVFQNSE